MSVRDYLDVVLRLWAERGETTVCRILGTSMVPLIRNGDAVVIDHGVRDARQGDIIVFRKSGRFVAHRVVGTMRQGRRKVFLTKGDGRSAFDDLVKTDRIVGRVIEVRGSRGHLEFNSLFWRISNRLLARLSYISGKQHSAASPVWKGVRLLFRAKSKVLPRRLSPSRTAVWCLCKMNRLRAPVRVHAASRCDEGHGRTASPDLSKGAH